jgi:hypothetical protein
MKLLLRCRRFTWMNLSTATLLTLLQRSPAARLFVAGAEYVAASPAGAILRSAAASVAALGAYDSLAGATVLSSSQATPLNVTAGSAITPVAFTVTNTINIGSWKVTGTLPPGLSLSAVEGGGTLTGPGTLDATTPGQSDGYGGTTGGNSTTTPKLTGTPTTAGTYTFNLQAYEYGALSGLVSGSFPFTVVVAGGSTTTPTPVTTPPPVTTPAPVVAPALVTQPLSVTLASGSTLALNAAASGSPTYQWSLNGAPIAGATGSTLLIPGATAANAGSYTVKAVNSAGSATSNAATVSVVSTTDVGRLINLSTRVQVGTGANVLIVGFVVGGNGTSGGKSMLIRGTGPALASFGVTGVLADPVLTLSSGSTAIATNDNWAGSALITSTDSSVGAFPLTSPSSLDAALVTSLNSGAYTAQVAGNNNGTGVALAEVYDTTPSTAFSPTTPRLVNLSARVQVGTGSNVLIAGFVIGGSSAKTMLVRASGPALVPFGVSGTLPDPQLQLSNAQGTVIASNNGWAGNAQVVAAAASVGAFPWATATSGDSAILITLPPGGYSAQVSGASGDTGVALVEVYEVP